MAKVRFDGSSVGRDPAGMRDMASLVDLPELAGDSEPPTSEITLFKLGRFRHARFGRWEITPEVFDSFVRNFKGRAPVDLDHSADRQGSTEAAGWVTALRVVANTLRATVEWTGLGAEAIRDRRFMYISPTWSFNASDETGKKIGPKLVGAGLTNRPHFDLPALNLSSASADAFAQMAIEPEPDYGPDDFDAHFEIAQDHGIDPEHRDLYRDHWALNNHLHHTVEGEARLIEGGLALQRLWGDWTTQDRERARRPRRPGEFAEPAGLDADGIALHQQVVAYAQEHAIVHYGAAFEALTGRRRAQEFFPPAQTAPFEVPDDATDEQAELMADLDGRARAFAAREEVDYVDAGQIVQIDDQLDEAKAETGASATEWLDTSRDMHPKPWSEEHYESDRRRAATIEWDLTREEWQAAAELGEDIVYVEADRRRRERLEELRARRGEWLLQAKEREARRRKQAIEAELRDRAERRLKGGLQTLPEDAERRRAFERRPFDA